METTQQLTHWKKLTNPDYIGSYILEPGKDMILTIKSVAKEMVTGSDGKKEEMIVIQFMENGVKPMICNKTNAKTITKIHKTPYIQQWSGKKIQIYSSSVNAFGTTTDALRVRDFVPMEAKVDVTDAILKITECTTLDQLKSVYSSLTKAEQSDSSVIELKDKVKSKLS